MLLRLWMLVLLVCVSAFAPSRAGAREAETLAWVFAPQTVETRPESEPQAAGTHQENGLWNYEHAPGCTQAAESGAAKSFFEGTRYTPKVLKQMEGGAGEFHSFPRSVEAFENAGSVRTITGGDKVVREVLEIPGSYGGRDGVFQFIKNPDGTINHRLFVPNKP